jgi:hypothetical protein
MREHMSAMHPNRRLLTDVCYFALRAQFGAAKPER